jgi:hypothetical protein
MGVDGAAWRGGFDARPSRPTTAGAGPTATAAPGPRAPSGSSSPIPATPAGKCREHTINTVLQQARVGITPTTTTTTVDPRVSEYDAKIAKYRAALEAGADPKLVTTWIAEAQAARQRAIALRPKPSPQDDEILRLTARDLERILDQLGDLVAALRSADPEQKLDLYRALGLQRTYQPDTRTVHAVVDLGEHRWDLVGVRGQTSAPGTRQRSRTTC